jgi:hypothetical protein
MSYQRIGALNGPFRNVPEILEQTENSNKAVNAATAALVAGVVIIGTRYACNQYFSQRSKDDKMKNSEIVLPQESLTDYMHRNLSTIPLTGNTELDKLRVENLTLRYQNHLQEIENTKLSTQNLTPKQKSTIVKSVLGLAYSYADQLVREEAKNNYPSLRNGAIAIGTYVAINYFSKK